MINYDNDFKLTVVAEMRLWCMQGCLSLSHVHSHDLPENINNKKKMDNKYEIKWILEISKVHISTAESMQI